MAFEKFVNGKAGDWVDLLPEAVRKYNRRVHRAFGR
jgi:hypothetical protein